MYIRDLPEEEKRQLRELIEAAGEQWELVEKLSLNELQDWMRAREEDVTAQLERKVRRRAVLTELDELAERAVQIAGDVEMWKLEYFLHGEDRVRFQQLMRELDEMSQVPLVTRNRQSWHAAVEQELSRDRKGGFTIEQLSRLCWRAIPAIQRNPCGSMSRTFWKRPQATVDHLRRGVRQEAPYGTVPDGRRKIRGRIESTCARIEIKRMGVAPVAPAAPGQETAAAQKAQKNKPAEPKTDEQSFWDFGESLGDRWLSGDIKAYVYRILPKIDRQQDRVYLAIIQEPPTEDLLLRRFGSGRYLIMIKDRNKLVRKHTVSVHNRLFPPQVDVNEVIADDPANASYFRAWGKPNEIDTQGRGKGETAEILREVFEKGAKIDPTLVDLWKEASSQRDELAKILASQQQQSAPQAQPNLLELLAHAKALQGDPLSMLSKLRDFFPREHERSSAEQSPPDPLDGLKKMLDVFGQARELFTPEPAAPAAAAVGPSADMELMERVALTISGQVGQIVSSLPGIIMAWKSHGGAVPAATVAVAGAAAGPPRPSGAFNPYADPAAARAFVQQQTAAASATQPQGATSQFTASPGVAPAPPATSEATASAQGAGIEQQVIGLISSALNCLNRGITGHEFADAIIVTTSDLEYEGIVNQIRKLTVPAVIALAKGIPQLGEHVTAYEVQFTRFLSEFVEGPNPDDSQEAESAESEERDNAGKKPVMVA